MHLKSDCIFKAVFGLKYSLRNSLSIWYGKSVLKITRKKRLQKFLVFGCLEIIARYHKNRNFGATFCFNISCGPHWHMNFFFIIWDPLRLSSNLFKKFHVQARTWGVEAISKVICAHFALYKYLHNSSSLRSTVLI